MKHKATEEEKFCLFNSQQIFSYNTRNSNFINRFEGSYQRHKIINETIFNILEHMGNAP
jgi:hypothetical protein